MAKTIGQLQAELKQLGTKSQGTLYRRLQIADTLLKSEEFMEQFGGKLDEAEDQIAADGFPVLAGTYSVGELMVLFREFPKARWEEYRYNLKAMQALYDEQRASEGETRERKSWKETAQQSAEELESVGRQLKNVQQLLEHEQTEKTELSLRVRELEHENAVLRGRIEELEKLVRVQTV